ncbi:tRNA lysidine(34) synthetase TilS [Pelagibacteraceae bacterium]|nr:tRNA lysidine(34) synthetase TilS [Pelagibacteraceae bacterium]
MSKKDSSVLKLKDLVLSKKILNIYYNFRSQVNSSIKKNSFLVAVSGGPDSLSLSALSKAYSEEKKNRVHYVLVDHGIRQDSKKEALAVKNLFKKKGLSLTILKNKKKINKNIQSQARVIRYELLLNYCNKKKIKFILTGHHRDDQIETFLIRLSRGSGVQGLSSMNRITKLNNKTKLLRPLLSENKEDLTFLAKKYFGKIFKDPSNVNRKYLRTNIRDLIKQLEKSGIKRDQIINSINNLADSRDTLNSYIQSIEEKCLSKKKGVILMNLKYFLLENKNIQLKILSDSLKYISKKYYPPRAKKVLNLIQRIKAGEEIKVTLGGCIIRKRQNNLIISIEK